MKKAIAKRSRGSIILNISIGIAAIAAVIWLVMDCPSCH